MEKELLRDRGPWAVLSQFTPLSLASAPVLRDRAGGGEENTMGPAGGMEAKAGSHGQLCSWDTHWVRVCTRAPETPGGTWRSRDVAWPSLGGECDFSSPFLSVSNAHSPHQTKRKTNKLGFCFVKAQLSEMGDKFD